MKCKAIKATAPKELTIQDKYNLYINNPITKYETMLFDAVQTINDNYTNSIEVSIKGNYIYYHIDEHAHYRVINAKWFIELLMIGYSEEYINVKKILDILEHIYNEELYYIEVYHHESCDTYLVDVTVKYDGYAVKKIAFDIETSTDTTEQFLVDLFIEQYLEKGGN